MWFKHANSARYFKGSDRYYLPLKDGEEADNAWERQRPYWNVKSDAVYYAVSKHSRTHLYRHPLKGEKTALPFPDGTILFFKVSKDGKTVVALYSSRARCYGKKQGDPLYNPNADIDGNGVINIFDVVICTGHYGQKWP